MQTAIYALSGDDIIRRLGEKYRQYPCLCRFFTRPVGSSLFAAWVQRNGINGCKSLINKIKYAIAKFETFAQAVDIDKEILNKLNNKIN